MGDFDFLGRLPVIYLQAPTRQAYRVKDWPWPVLASYNGFTGEDRIRAWQFQWWLQDHGCLPFPKVCSICGSREKVTYHAENYYDVTSMASICGACHSPLHKRFKSPAGWSGIVRTFAKTGREWFACLPATEPDVKSHLRAKHPRVDFGNFFRSPFYDLPQGVKAMSPTYRDLAPPAPHRQGPIRPIRAVQPVSNPGPGYRIRTRTPTPSGHN